MGWLKKAKNRTGGKITKVARKYGKFTPAGASYKLLQGGARLGKSLLGKGISDQGAASVAKSRMKNRAAGGGVVNYTTEQEDYS